MIKRSKRLNRAIFDETFLQGETIPTRFFLVKKRKVSDFQSRFAVSVSKKQAIKAVMRNRIRRRMYTALSPFIDNVQGVYMIFLPKRDILNIPLSELRTHIQRVLERLD